MDDVGKENQEVNQVAQPGAVMSPEELAKEQVWLDDRLRQIRGEEPLTAAQQKARDERLQGERQVARSRQAKAGIGATLALAGGLAGCKIAKEKFATSTPIVKQVIHVEPTPTERPRIIETVFGEGREPMYIMGGLTGAGMGGSEGLNGTIKVHEGDINWIKGRVDAEAFKSAEVAEVSPRLWTPFLDPRQEMMIGIGEEGALGIVMPKGEEGKATQAYKVEKIGDITPLTLGKMEYFCFPESSFEPVTEDGDKPIEGLMGLRERGAEQVLDVYEIDTKLDALGVVLGVRMAQRLPNGEFAKDAEGKYVFEGEKEKAIVILTSSADEMTQSVTVMKGELYPVGGKLREGILCQFDYSMMRCIFSAKNAQGTMERMALTYDPFTGKWEGGIKEQVLEEKVEIVAPQIEGLKVVKEGGAIVYRAEIGNKYGVEVGAWAGEYRENVTMAVQNDERRVESKKSGGLILNSLVAEKILWSEIAKIPEQKDKWLVVLPGDMTVLDLEKGIKIETEVAKSSGLKVSFDGIAPMVDIVPYAHKLYIGSSSRYGGVGYLDESIRGFSPCDQIVCEGKEMYYVSVGGPLIDCPLNTTVQSKFGKQIAKTRGYFVVFASAPQEVRNITVKKVLSVGGVPVFVAENK
jgi:hypothetical protein